VKNINSIKKYKIITMDDNGNLLVGHFEIKNFELLRAFRDFLARDNFDNFKVIERNTGCANGVKVPVVEVVDNCLVKRDDFREEYIKTFYKEYIYEAMNLNTFLLCSSLLGEMNINNFGKMAREFVKYDIFKLLSLPQAWKKCSKNFYKSFNSQDFETFSELLTDGRFIEYVVDDVIEYKNLKNARPKLLNELKLVLDDEVYMNEISYMDFNEFLIEVSHNSKILGTSRKRHRFGK